MGVVGGTGGAYGQQFIDAFSFTYTEAMARSFTNDLELAAGTASALAAASPSPEGLPLAVGLLVFNAGSSLDAAPAAGTDPDLPFVRFGDLRVLGDSALSVAPEGRAAIAGDTWTFTPGAVLTVTGAVALPETVTIVIDGTIPNSRMNLVDFSGAEITNLAEVNFVLAGGDATDRVNFRNGWLYTTGTLGTFIRLR